MLLVNIILHLKDVLLQLLEVFVKVQLTNWDANTSKITAIGMMIV